MNEFRETFRATANSLTDGIIVPAIMDFGDDSDKLTIPAQNPNGFDIELECFDYGVYPTSSTGWHSGAWDVTVLKPKELEASLTEFIYSVLNDAVLDIFYSNKKPHKWVLHLQFEGERIFDETGLILFNWLGKRNQISYSNGNKQPNQANSTDGKKRLR
jgi:hypothetical protein